MRNLISVIEPERLSSLRAGSGVDCGAGHYVVNSVQQTPINRGRIVKCIKGQNFSICSLVGWRTEKKIKQEDNMTRPISQRLFVIDESWNDDRENSKKRGLFQLCRTKHICDHKGFCDMMVQIQNINPDQQGLGISNKLWYVGLLERRARFYPEASLAEGDPERDQFFHFKRKPSCVFNGMWRRLIAWATLVFTHADSLHSGQIQINTLFLFGRFCRLVSKPPCPPLLQKTKALSGLSKD
ncbi:hypothetical protein JZ751_014889 [Albula glossodonta]|uniref:Uncharacterized protein n=1 Tax=Albula glossodonta TaxID=121402 RepID=A0A8T2N015_9TELE|nr:hypothetical protein JZ751_014889 [Albula glossodonta]